MRSLNLRPFGLTASLVLIALVVSGCFQTAGAALDATSTPQGGPAFVPAASPTSDLPTAITFPPTEVLTETPTETPTIDIIQFPSETATPDIVQFPTETPVTEIAFVASPTPFPDQPTYTPYPTFTPPPTYTPEPTYTPLPTAADPIITPNLTLVAVQVTDQAIIDATSTQIIIDATSTESYNQQQTQIAIYGFSPTPPPIGGAEPTPEPPAPLPTGQFIPVYVTATPAGTPGVPGSFAAGYFDGTTCRYFVVDGDTMYSIARRLTISVSRLAAANGIVNTELIRPGQYLRVPQPYCSQSTGAIPTQIIVIGGPATSRPPGSIPPLGNSGKTYKVREGDTLFGIAARFGISATALAQANNIRNISLIYMGQVLVIP
jgi:LysM repeat protein